MEATAARSTAQKKARSEAEAEAKRRYEAELRKLQQERKKEAEAKRRYEAELSKLQQERKKEAEAKRRYEAELSKLQQGRKKVSAAELAFWDTINGTKDPEDYQAYLDAYPKGGFVALARVRSGHPFDGQWIGSMRCGSCANCLGPLEKPISISVKNSKFDIIPDATYLGTGKIDDEGNVKIDRSRNSPDYVNVKKSRRNFRFRGKYEGESFVLHGKRGLRSCEITLSRVSSM